MKQRFFPCVLFLLLLGISPAICREISDLKLDKARLEAGKIQTFTYELATEEKSDGVKKRCIGVILIDAPPAVCWQYLLDWDSMGAFVPGLEYYKTIVSVRPTGEEVVGESLIEGKLKFPLLTILYTLNVTFDAPQYRQEWRLATPAEVDTYAEKGVEITRSTGGVKNIEGFGYIEPYDNGAKTIYYYAPIVETSLPVPAFVERFIANSTLPGYMEGMKKRIESRGTYKK